MSRWTRQQRRERQEAYDALARRGEEWLQVRETGSFTDLGFATFQEYIERRVVRQIIRGMSLTPEQARKLVDEGLQLAEARRVGARGRKRRV